MDQNENAALDVYTFGGYNNSELIVFEFESEDELHCKRVNLNKVWIYRSNHL